MRNLLTTALFVLLLSARIGFTQTPRWKVNDKVILFRGTKFDNAKTQRVYTVEEVKGDSLLIGSNGTRGWVPANAVLAELSKPVDTSVRQVTSVQAEGARLEVASQRMFPQTPQDLDDIRSMFKSSTRTANSTSSIGEGVNWQADYKRASSTWLWKRDSKAAIALCDLALRKKRNAFEVYELKAQILAGIKDFDGAIVTLRKAELQCPLSTFIFSEMLASNYRMRGIARCEAKQYDAALADLNESIKLNASDAEAVVWRATVHHSLGDLQCALQDLNRAVELNPRDPFAIRQRGALHGLSKRWSAAERDCETCLRIDANDIDACIGLARVLTESDRFTRNAPRAIELATRACELTEQKNPFALMVLARALADQEQFGKAINLQKQANELFTDDQWRASGNSWLRNFEKGEAALAKAPVVLLINRLFRMNIPFFEIRFRFYTRLDRNLKTNKGTFCSDIGWNVRSIFD